jgi:molybdenum-dependent DNA-binding transcriptional regulator ModE
MRRRIFPLLLALLLAIPALVLAQDRSSELDKAYAESRAAYLALQEAEKRRDQGVEPQAGDRQGSAAGGTRPTDQYVARQATLEMEVEQARRRYEAAVKRWNDLK